MSYYIHTTTGNIVGDFIFNNLDPHLKGGYTEVATLEEVLGTTGVSAGYSAEELAVNSTPDKNIEQPLVVLEEPAVEFEKEEPAIDIIPEPTQEPAVEPVIEEVVKPAVKPKASNKGAKA